MVLLDTSIVNVAIPSIRNNLGASFAEIQWVLAGYTLAYALLLITGGRLGDLYGRKRLFMIGMAGFTLASALCGLAPGSTVLVGSRVVQGVMAALMFPQALSVIQVSFAPRERGAALGIFGAVVGLATIMGPLAGGLIIGNDTTGGAWRFVFLVNVPVGVVSLAAAAWLMRESRSPQASRLDLAGVSIASLGLFMLVFPLVEGRDANWAPWTYISMAAQCRCAGCVRALRADHQPGRQVATGAAPHLQGPRLQRRLGHRGRLLCRPSCLRVHLQPDAAGRA
jgi:MFS family permease